MGDEGHREAVTMGFDSEVATPDVNAVEAALLQPLPDGWSAAISRQTGGVFYVNRHTGETQAQPPTLPAPALDPPNPEIVPLPLTLMEAEPEPEPEPAHFLPVSPSATSYDHDEDMDRSVGAKPWIEPSKAPSAGELEAGLSVAPCLIEAENFLTAMDGRSPSMGVESRRATQLSHACIAAGKECLCVAETEDEYKAVLDLFNTAWRLTPDHPKLGQLIADASEASTFALASRRGSSTVALPPHIHTGGDEEDSSVVAVPQQGVAPDDEIDDAVAAVAAAVAEGAAATVCAPRIRFLKVCNVPRPLFEIGALHFRLLEDERSSLAGAGAVEVFDSRATPPYGAERINRASEMTENPHTHAIVSMAVIEYSVEVRLPPSPSEPTLVLYYTPDGYQSGGKLVPVLSVRLTESVLRAGVVGESSNRGASREMVCRIESEQLSLAVGQRTSGLDRVWLELAIVEGGGVPRHAEY